ncbi:hypothetical protein [Secundilactobacillus yichangensis]|uniref:hypothetical protein n=1 Tax=Secundilactobacillus yichangensis TaxID=2799580 RepID=UPI0019444074|nr:hypothetical protein [Secundilactobacillus yichangensis]
MRKPNVRMLGFLVGVGMLLFALGACGSQENAAKTSKVAFMKTAQNSQKQVWFLTYLTREVHKDTPMELAIVTQKGRATAYRLDDNKNNTLNSFKGLSNKQIITKIKKVDKASFNLVIKNQETVIKRAISTAKEELKNDKSNSEYRSDLKVLNTGLRKFQSKNFKYHSPESYKLTANATTDDNDKNLTKEVIHFKDDRYTFEFSPEDANDLTKLERVSNSTDYVVKSDSLFFQPIQILSKYFVGYSGLDSNLGSDKYQYLITQTTNKKASSVFDNKKTSGISVDQ